MVSGSPWDDDVATKAALEAAERLRNEYSTVVYVEIQNESLVSGYAPWDMPSIIVGNKHLDLIPETVSYPELVEWIVQAALEEIGNEASVFSKPPAGVSAVWPTIVS